MTATTRHTVSGRILAVQEQRFRLVTDAGQGLLLTLSRNASVGQDDLQRWLQTETHVDVTYEGQPNFASGIAHAIKPTSTSLTSDDARL